MKKQILIALVLTLTLFACSKEKVAEQVDNLLTFDIPYTPPPFEIPKTGTVGQPLPDHPAIPVVVPVPGSTNPNFGKYGTRADLVKEARVKKVSLSILKPPAETFNFLKSIKLFISDSLGNNEQLLAYKDSVPPAANSFDMDMKTDVVLDEYVKASSFRLKSEFTLRNGTADSLQVQADLLFGIKANPVP